MPSFVQTRFHSGQWSELAQGRMEDPAYKTGMNVCYNGLPMEAGPWARRPGTRFIAHTKGGAAGRLIDYTPSQHEGYQFEFTAGFVRFYRGLSHVYQQGVLQNPSITNVSVASEAVFTLDAMPAGWANGDTVVVDLGQTPCTVPLLCGRQFIISDLSGATFKLKDAVTLEYFDNSANVAYTVDAAKPDDTIFKVSELATPYTGTTWQSCRGVQDIDNLLVLHGSYQPRKITENVSGSVAPFAIAAQDFTDGPYLDINTTSTTLTLSGLSGSVTVTSNSVVNINGGLGFQTTDIGRLIRWQSGPAVWSNATTYNAGAVVLSAAGVVFKSILGTNLNHNPDTDDGTYWEVTGDTPTWVWLKITARTDTLHVTATVMGDAAKVTTATTTWRLGRYSDTSGWPTCGAYHEGRLWIAGADSNHIDGSKSNDAFNFSPTAADGTVADNNAVSATANAVKANTIYWMISTEDGLMLGTDAGEWRVKSTSLDDPVGPSTIQMRQVSTYGCDNQEPVNAGQIAFIQSKQRKLLAHVRASENEYLAENLSITGDNASVSGIAEIVWHQEPFLTIWGRRNDGALIGCFYKRAESSYAQKSLEQMWGQSAVGWHVHALGSGRTVESLSTGPAPDGLSDTTYMVTNDASTGIRYVEMLRPSWDDEQEDWAGAFVDAGAEACCARIMKIDYGDSFDGIRIYGCWHLNGRSVVPIVASLDLGDRTVTDGYVDIPFLSDPAGVFTESFLLSETGGDYGGLSTSLTDYFITYTTSPPAITTYSVQSFIGDGLSVVGYTNNVCLIDNYEGNIRDLHYQLVFTSGGDVGGVRVFNAATGAELGQKKEVDFLTGAQFLNTTNKTACFVKKKELGEKSLIIVPITSGNSQTIGAIDVTDPAAITLNASYGISSSDFVPDGNYDTMGDGFYLNDGSNTHVPAPRSSMAWVETADTDYVFYNAGSSATNLNMVVAFQVFDTELAYRGFYNYAPIGNAKKIDICPGTSGPTVANGTYIACLHKNYGTSSTDSWYFYESPYNDILGISYISGPTLFATLTPAMVDATWTKFSAFTGVMYDQYDRNVMVFATTDEAVATQNYLVKINRSTGVVMWTIALTFAAANVKNPQSASAQKIVGSFSVGIGGATDKMVQFDTIAGTKSEVSLNPGGSYSDAQLWDDVTASLTTYGGYTDTGSPDAVALNSTSFPFSAKWQRVYAGGPDHFVTSGAAPVDVTYLIPSTVGFTYTSRGQLLRPDFGQDAGAQSGPAFGKKRRIHWHATNFYRSRSVSIGADFDNMYPVKIQEADGTTIEAPTLYSGIVSDTVENDYSFNAQLAWEITRPYALTITATGGFLQTMDK